MMTVGNKKLLIINYVWGRDKCSTERQINCGNKRKKKERTESTFDTMREWKNLIRAKYNDNSKK